MTSINTYSRLSQPRRKLFHGTLSTTNRILYRCPEGKSAQIDSIMMINVHSGSETVTIYHTLPNETVGDSNTLYYQMTISSKTTNIDDTVKYMTSGESIHGLASSASRIVVAIYGIEQ